MLDSSKLNKNEYLNIYSKRKSKCWLLFKHQGNIFWQNNNKNLWLKVFTISIFLWLSHSLPYTYKIKMVTFLVGLIQITIVPMTLTLQQYITTCTLCKVVYRICTSGSDNYVNNFLPVSVFFIVNYTTMSKNESYNVV